MAYITKANSQRILRMINIVDVSLDSDEDVFHIEIPFFSDMEKKELLLLKCLLKDPDKFYSLYYHNKNLSDTYQFVYEKEHTPAYHLFKNCENLLSSYKNFKIPFEIKQRVREKFEQNMISSEEAQLLEIKEVKLFREWFSSHEQLYNNNPEEFLRQLDFRWQIQRKIEEINKPNSGVEDIKNLDLGELEQAIENIIEESGNYYAGDPAMKEIIEKFGKLTFLAKKSNIYGNNSGLSDIKLKEFLAEFDQKFKNPTKELLKQYFRLKFNPDLSFDGKLLEKLSFKKCYSCDCMAKIKAFEGINERLRISRLERGIKDNIHFKELLELESNSNLIIDENSKILNWTFIQHHRGFLNILFSTHSQFSNKELILFRNKLIFGGVRFDNPYDQNEIIELGLIYNENINSEDICQIYAPQMEEFLSFWGNDLSSIDSQRKFSLDEELEKLKNLNIEWILSNSSYNDGIFENIGDELTLINDLFDSIQQTTFFTHDEILKIISDNNTLYIYNKHFFKQTLEFLQTEVNFKIRDFYLLQRF